MCVYFSQYSSSSIFFMSTYRWKTPLCSKPGVSQNQHDWLNSIFLLLFEWIITSLPGNFIRLSLAKQQTVNFTFELAINSPNFAPTDSSGDYDRKCISPQPWLFHFLSPNRAEQKDGAKIVWCTELNKQIVLSYATSLLQGLEQNIKIQSTSGLSFTHCWVRPKTACRILLWLFTSLNCTKASHTLERLLLTRTNSLAKLGLLITNWIRQLRINKTPLYSSTKKDTMT